MHTITAQQLRNTPDAAQQAADNAPALITRTGRLPQVLMRYDEYQRISGERRTTADVLRSLDHPGVSDIEPDIPPRSKAQRRPVDFGE